MRPRSFQHVVAAYSVILSIQKYVHWIECVLNPSDIDLNIHFYSFEYCTTRRIAFAPIENESSGPLQSRLIRTRLNLDKFYSYNHWWTETSHKVRPIASSPNECTLNSTKWRPPCTADWLLCAPPSATGVTRARAKPDGKGSPP